jgi:glucosyl-dolichyl phosphate glucuronosyltransferase
MLEKSIDVIICTYNNAVLLEKTLETIANQKVSTSLSWSVLVVDNNCTDHTATVIEQYRQAQHIPGLRRVVEAKQGLTEARLCGIHCTESEWIAFVDDDCFLAADWVEQAMEFATAHPQCGAFSGKVMLEWEKPPSSLLLKHQRSFAANDRGETSQQLSRADSRIPGAGFVIQRRALEQSGWLKHQFLMGRNGNALTSGDDSEIVLRILNIGYELWFAPTCKLYHFIPDQRISQSYLVKLTYGLGTADPYLASLRWNRSYYSWLLIMLARVTKYLVLTLGYSVLALWQVYRREEVEIIWSWTKGQMDTLHTLLTLPKVERDRWLNIFEPSLWV